MAVPALSSAPPARPAPASVHTAHVAAAAWRPGLARAAEHGEVFAAGGDAGGAGLALALARAALNGDERRWLWVQDAAAIRLGGRPYRPGLPPALRHRLIHVMAKRAEDALFALEEGLRCRDLAFVIGELAGNPRALDFTASRRLTLAAEKHGTPLWLVRLDAERDLSSARMRWTARSHPSAPPRWNPAAPGVAAWQAELFRARAFPPGQWILNDDEPGLVAHPDQQPGERAGERASDQSPRRSPDPGDLAAAAGDRPLAAG